MSKAIGTDIHASMVGQYVIARCTQAGVHAGYLLAVDGNKCTLGSSRRLWFWKAKQSAFLSGVAAHGIDQKESKIGAEVGELALSEWCELLSCTKEAQASIESCPEYTP